MATRQWPRVTFWRVVFCLLMGAGAVATVVRFGWGLGASTHLSDQFPWGLWIGFDILCGVGLAAGGFALTGAVYLFNLKRFTPIVRPTVLTAFLGYVFVSVALLYDIGRPLRIWHAMIMWNPHSVMFEVAWCVMLYTTILSLEFSPVVFERLNLERPRRIVRGITVPLVIVGVLLSTLHQSSLGTLFLIVPEKLHPLWYTPLLPVFFFLSAIAAGLGMVIVESYLSQRAFKRNLEMELLEPLGRTIVVLLSVYGVLRLQDLAGRGALAGLTTLSYEGSMFLIEFVLGVILPILVLANPKVRLRPRGLVTGAFLTVLGFVMNRLNVSVTGMEHAAGVSYFPSWEEIAISLALVAAGFAIFGQAVQHLPIFPEERGEGSGAHAAPTWVPPASPLAGFAEGASFPVPRPDSGASD